MSWLIPVLVVVAYLLIGVAIAVVALRRGFGDGWAYDDHDEMGKPMIAVIFMAAWPLAVLYGALWLLGVGVTRIAAWRTK